MSLRRALLAGVMALSAGTAHAADELAFGSQPGPGFSWAGSYLGVYAGWLFTPVGTIWRVGGQAGYNLVRGPLLIGVEGHGGVLITAVGPVAAEAELSARLGAILRGRFLLYGEAGIGMVADQGTYTFGGGGEIAVGDSFSVFAEAKRFGTFVSGCCNTAVQLGVNFHP